MKDNLSQLNFSAQLESAKYNNHDGEFKAVVNLGRRKIYGFIHAYVHLGMVKMELPFGQVILTPEERDFQKLLNGNNPRLKPRLLASFKEKEGMTLIPEDHTNGYSQVLFHTPRGEVLEGNLAEQVETTLKSLQKAGIKVELYIG